MTLSSIGAFAEGVSRGLRDVAAIHNIKNQQAAGEREAKRAEMEETTFQQQQADRTRALEEIPIQDWAGGKGRSPEEAKYAIDYANRLGVGLNGKIRRTEIQKVHDALSKDSHAMYDLLQLKEKRVGTELAKMQEDLKAIQMGPYAASPLQISSFNSQIKEKQTELNKLMYSDQNWVKMENARIEAEKTKATQELEKRKVAAQEKSAEAHEISAEKTTSLPGLYDKLSKLEKGSKEYNEVQSNIKALQEFELKKTKAGRAPSLTEYGTPSNTEKVFRFYKVIYPKLGDEEILQKINEKDIPSEAEWVLKAVPALDISPEEAKVMYREVVGKKPTPMGGGAEGEAVKRGFIKDPKTGKWVKSQNTGATRGF